MIGFKKIKIIEKQLFCGKAFIKRFSDAKVVP